MADRRWTVMIVPHGSDSPRSFSVSERALRAAGWAASVLGLIALIGIGSAIAQLGSLGGAAARSAAGKRSPELSAVAARIATLRDTIDEIRKREQQIRLLAGLPSTDSLSSNGAVLADASDLVEAGTSSTSPGSAHAEMEGDVEALITRAGVLSSRFAAVSDSLSRTAHRFASMPSIMPTAGWLTSQFSRRRLHPLLHRSRPHEGIDVVAPMGSAIVAPAAGVIRMTGNQSGYGLVVEIDHGNGIVTKYAHCSRILVRGGQRVTRGMTIAQVGSTGLSTGPHLHYEIRVDGKVVDPLTFVLPDAIPD